MKVEASTSFSEEKAAAGREAKRLFFIGFSVLKSPKLQSPSRPDLIRPSTPYFNLTHV
jgi:hypothetical protein